MRKILVTGADGFIGSHLTETLVQQGHKVTAFVQYNSFNSWGWLDHSSNEIRRDLNVFSADIRDPAAVRKAMEGVDVVYHLASLIAIPYSYIAPHSYVETNVNGTLNVVQAAKDLGTSRVVHTSTSEVYGTAKFVPITEDHPLQGQSPYSASKIGADQIAMSFFNAFETPVSIVRPFNTYGPRQSARAIIPTIISQIASGKRTLHLGDLTPTRDFNFVFDTVNGFIAVGESANTVGEVVNVGTGFEISIGDLVKLIIDVMGEEVEIVQDSDRIRPAGSEVFRLCGCAKKAKALTGWEPKFAGIEGLRSGIQETANWFTDPANLAMYKADVYNV
ncbi:NAD-dependent 4,6-dehydratase LegB [Rhodopirellula baltica]|uniref:NAD-dependent 4,6-dehydratase LegB n=1 Tax=Rhodopirellula baltica TaxID=265606 RepID=UPI000561DCEC|nr:NAD-dependent 4,6-dehydratase LegB [Rhodopirellula baltica]